MTAVVIDLRQTPEGAFVAILLEDATAHEFYRTMPCASRADALNEIALSGDEVLVDVLEDEAT